MNVTRRLLLVEDEAIIALHEQSILERNGFSVECCANGTAAVEAATRADSPFDLVLMDIDLGPGLDGIEAATRILSQRALPIVFLTSHDEPATVARVEELTQYGYILKNGSDFALVQSLKTALRLFDAHRETAVREERFRQIFDRTPTIAIQGYRPDGTVVFWNAASESLYGYTAEEALGASLFDLIIPEPMQEMVRRSMAETVRTGVAIGAAELELRGKDGSPVFVYSSHATLTFPDREPEIFCLDMDITDRKEAQQRARLSQEEVRVSERRLARVLDNLPVAVLISSAPNEDVLRFNREFTRLFGYTGEDIPNAERWFELAYPDAAYRAEVAEQWRQAIADAELKGGDIGPVGANVVCSDGTRRNISVRGHHLDDLYMIVFDDLTQAVADQRELEALVEAKDHLMKELNHRVKNNLALVSSMVRLKGDALGGIDLSDIGSQIDSIALIHETLMDSEDPSRVDFGPYVGRLLAGAFSLHAGGPVEVENGIPEILIPARTAVALGVILNELATNAMKHAFGTAPGARFTVTLSRDDATENCLLEVRNSGKPFPEGVTFENPGTLGLRLVAALVSQLHGAITLERRPETTVRIQFICS